MTSTSERVDPQGPNAGQIEHWNGAAGAAWSELDERITQQIRPFGLHALARAAVAPGSRVLDVGCGSGETTRALARLAGPTGAVTGLDISTPLLALARSHAAREGLDNVRFELADAQLAPLPEGAFDLLFSRFGVMFFADPVAAFQNLHRALRPGGRACFVCWRGPEHNPWLSVPFMAAALHVQLAPPVPGAPGPLAFADPERLRGILGAAGFTEVALDVVAETVSIGGPGELEAAIDFMMRIGPTASALRTVEAPVKEAVAAAMRRVLAPWHTPEHGLRMAGEAWLVTATRP
jgi:SAM-dependent methyltransferase